MLAIVILSTAMLAIMEGLSRSLNAVESIRNTHIALELLSMKLGELYLVEELEESEEEGDFEEVRPGFRWTQSIEATEQTDLYLVRISILWNEQGREVAESVETYQYRMSEGARRLSEEARRPGNTPGAAPRTRQPVP